MPPLNQTLWMLLVASLIAIVCWGALHLLGTAHRKAEFEEAILFPLAATPKAQPLIPYCRSWRCHEQLSPRKLCGEIHSKLAARHCRSAPAPQHQVMGNSDSVIFDRKPLLVDQRSGDVACAHRGAIRAKRLKFFRNQHSPARQAHVAMRRPASSRIWPRSRASQPLPSRRLSRAVPAF